MQLYKEDKFLVMIKDMKLNDSLETINSMLEQLGITWKTSSFEIEPYQPVWYHESPEPENAADKFLKLNPWLEEYKVVQDSNLRYPHYRNNMKNSDYRPELRTYYTNIEAFRKIGRQPDHDKILNLTKCVTPRNTPESMYISLEDLCITPEIENGLTDTETSPDGRPPAEPARFFPGTILYPDNYFKNMISISSNRARFFRITLRLLVNCDGQLSEPFQLLEQRCIETLGTLTESRYAAAYAEEELADLKKREVRFNEQLESLIDEIKLMGLPYSPEKVIAPAAKGCSIKKAFMASFQDTGFEFIDARNFCFKASKKSRYGYIYRLSIDYGGHIWHAHTLILEVSGINFRRTLLRIDGLTPQSQEECRMNLVNFKTQIMRLIEVTDPLFLKQYGETPQWFTQYRKYN